jgi:hypothetical protein
MYVCMIRIKKKDDTEDAIIIVNLRAEKTPDRFFFFWISLFQKPIPIPIPNCRPKPRRQSEFVRTWKSLFLLSSLFLVVGWGGTIANPKAASLLFSLLLFFSVYSNMRLVDVVTVRVERSSCWKDGWVVG